MNHPGSGRRGPELSEIESKFALEYVTNGGNGTRAARDVGYKDPANSARNLMSRPRVLEFIEKLKADRADAFKHECLTLEELAREKGITQIALAERLWQMANMPPLGKAGISGQVKAAEILCEIFGMMPSQQVIRKGAIEHADGSRELYVSEYLKSKRAELAASN